MDIRGLKLKATFTLTEQSSHQLDWLAVESKNIALAPLFTVSEGQEGEFHAEFPSEFELEHLTKDLSFHVRVNKSEISGLLLEIIDVDSSKEAQWEQLLVHLEERVERMARVYPRITIPEFNIGVSFPREEAHSGKIFDLSMGGMKVLSDLTVSVGSNVEFQLEIPNGFEWAVSAHHQRWHGIVKNRQMRGFGLEFAENHPFRERVKMLIDGFTKHRVQRLIYPRYNVFEFGTEGILEVPDQTKRNIRLKDISVSGSYVLGDAILPVDTEITLHVSKSERYRTLVEDLPLPGRVVRITPDGLVIQFSNLSETSSIRLNAWIKEIAGSFRIDIPAPQKERVVPKTTLSISYGSDLLFIREYLYNLSSGGFFLAGLLPLRKGDIVRFVLDFSGTTFMDRFPSPPSFLGTVVRTSDQGIGVQFQNPDEVRAELESVMGDLLKKQPPRNYASELPEGVEEVWESKSAPILERPPFSPSMFTIVGVITTIGLGFALLYRKFVPAPIVFDSDVQLSSKQPIAQVTPAAPEEMPESVQIANGTLIQSVVIADITDATFDRKTGPKVILKDGSVVPGEALLYYLPTEMKEKINREMKEDLEKMHREDRSDPVRRAAVFNQARGKEPPASPIPPASRREHH